MGMDNMPVHLGVNFQLSEIYTKILKRNILLFMRNVRKMLWEKEQKSHFICIQFVWKLGIQPSLSSYLFLFLIKLL